jgi:branched-chain amino acid transport system substrate-binding protein
MKSEDGSGWAIMGYMAIQALAEGMKKAGSTDSDKVSKALLGLTFDTPVGKRTINAESHESEAGEFWGEMVKDPKYPYAVMKNPEYLDPGKATN